VPITDDQFASLQFDGYSWDGRLSTEWMPSPIEFIIHSDEFTGQDYETLSAETKEYVGKVADLNRNSFTELELYLFRHYQQSIFLKIYPECEYAPRIATASDLWTIVSEPSILIPSLTGRQSEKVGFYTLFDCSWDPEHGFAVEHNIDFTPQSVVGSDQCCY